MPLRFLHTNDLHGALTPALAGQLRARRDQCDLYFDSGDAIKSGNLALPLKPEPVWPLLRELRCDASTLGNRETHILEGVLESKLHGLGHPIVCANMRRKDGSRPFSQTLVLESAGLKVGIVGVMVPMVTERMASRLASAYLWDPPISMATSLGNELRPEVDLLLALTHIGYREDLRLAETGVFDVILGGHSHTVLSKPELVAKTWICQGGSHARYVGRYAWDGELTGGLEPIAG